MNELPPLPEPDVPLPDDWAIRENWAEQMKAYALSAVQMERERCAKLVESQKFWVVVPELAEIAAQGDVMTDVLNHAIYGPVAAAIRSPSKEG